MKIKTLSHKVKFKKCKNRNIKQNKKNIKHAYKYVINI